MLSFRYSYLYKLHSESFMGFNAVCLPGNTPGAFYRSSLPATPVSTPIRENGRFSAQALRERLCRTPSPRKYRLFEPRASETDVGFNVLDGGLQLSSPDDEIDEETPTEFNPLQARGQRRLEQLELEKDNAARLKRRIFVGNISYRVTKEELQDFFSKFGRVVDCLIVQDHIRKRSRGYGFVIFSNQPDAEKARNASSSELECDGRVLRVVRSEEKKSAKFRKEAQDLLFHRNLDDDDVSPENYERDPLFFKTRICRSESLQNINELNDDMLLLIFSYLSIKERIKLETVCKRWKNLAIKLWRSIETLDSWQDFSIYDRKPLTNHIVRCLLKKCTPHLKKLDLSTASHALDYQALDIIALYCPNLEYINLTTVKVTNVSVQQLAIKCPRIKYAILQRCLEVGEKGIWWLLHLCKKLESIDLTGNPRITGQCFHMASPSLKTVVLNSCPRFSPVGFTKVATRCRQLTTLHLSDCYKLTDRALELLCQSLKSLVEFHVSGMFQELTSTGLHHIGRLNNLENLSLSHNRNVDDDVIYAISRGCRKLKVLNISGCYTGISDYSLSSLASCYNLRKLYISYLDKITDEGLSSLSRQGMLEYLQMRGCPNVGDQGLLTLVLLSPHLSHLDVSGCEHVTNSTVTACLDSVQARSPSLKLFLIVGGTSVELEALEIDSPLLEVSRQNYCDYSLGPNSFDDPYPCIGICAEEGDEFVMELPGAIGGAVGGTDVDATESTEETQSIFDAGWSDISESPL